MVFQTPTDLWQPVDAGYVKILKTLMEQEHHRWLDDEEHADRWYGNEEPYSAKERRILITHWAGEAYKKLCGDEYNEFRKTLWLKTGCLITPDGSNDDKIASEGLPNYQVPPPSQYLEPAVQPPESNGVEFEEPPPSDTIVANDDNSLPDGRFLASVLIEKMIVSLITLLAAESKLCMKVVGLLVK